MASLWLLNFAARQRWSQRAKRTERPPHRGGARTPCRPPSSPPAPSAKGAATSGAAPQLRERDSPDNVQQTPPPLAAEESGRRCRDPNPQSPALPNGGEARRI